MSGYRTILGDSIPCGLYSEELLYGLYGLRGRIWFSIAPNGKMPNWERLLGWPLRVWEASEATYCEAY
jgi:hypothetical protein